MPARPRLIYLLFSALMVLALAQAPAALSGDSERTIYKKIKAHIKAGNELAACKEALEMADYKDSEKYYPKAQAMLIERGISIEDPLTSWSIKRMITLQNKLEKYRASTGVVPRTGYRKKYTDAWGRPVRVELVTKAGFAYLLRSAGKDGRFLTDDDLVIGIRQDNVIAEEDYGAGSDPARRAGRRSMIRGGSGGGSGGRSQSASPGLPGGSSPTPQDMPKTSGGDMEIELDDLLKR